MTKRTKKHVDGVYFYYEGQNTIKLKPNSEVHKGALSDPDAKPLTTEDLAKFKRVNPFPNKE